MKRLILLFLLLSLTGCAAVIPNEYLSVTPHVDSSSPTSNADAVTAENYLSLKNAILDMVRTGQTEGLIHVTNYDGDVESDLAEAAYEVSKLDPLGAYAVDYMTHSCTQIVSYYEIRINTTFRRTAQEIAQIRSVSTQTQLQEAVQNALTNYNSRLTLRISSYREQEQEIPSLVSEHCSTNPATVMETPAVSVSVYPENGNVRILEINFTYTNTPEDLHAMEAAVRESIDAAAEYIRYRETDRDKGRLLFTYLMERFQYQSAETAAPLYDALCGGIATPTGLAQAWQLICDRAGMACFTVSGMRDGQPYIWNIVSDDGYYRHLDLPRCVMDLGELTLWTDSEMTSYSWSQGLYPACDPIPPAPPVEDPPMEEDPDLPEGLLTLS